MGGMLFDIQQKAGLTNTNFVAGSPIGYIISAAIPLIFTIAGMLLLLYLITGGLQLMISRGDPKAAGAAKSHISNALIGFIIIFIAFWVVQLFGLILGLSGINSIFGGNPASGSIPSGPVCIAIGQTCPTGQTRIRVSNCTSGVACQ